VRLRFVRFNLVGAGGILVQLSTLWVLVHVAGLDPAAATVVAVASSVTHNFLWHRRWTWHDRTAAHSPIRTFLAFVLGNGAVSLVGNVAVTVALVHLTSIGAVPANVAAIALCGCVNYWLADRVVFGPSLDVVRTSSPTTVR
jgi:putative flippase GtrA